MVIAPSDNENPEQGSIDYLMANPIPVHNFKALSREEIYNRSNKISRKPELRRGAFVISNDFDDPLPNDLINPPFGMGSNQTKAKLEAAYPRTKNDVYGAFVERGLQLLGQRGQLGAITSRTGFFLSSFQKWREEILLQEARPSVFADLGYGVLDAAMVETAAYCLSKEVA